MQDCKVADFLAVVLRRDKNMIRQKLGAPTRYGNCLNCDVPLLLPGRLFCSRLCHYNYVRVDVCCDQCSDLFRIRKRFLIHRLNKKSQQRFFCSQSCKGQYAGQHYGFRVHPENAGRLKPKWDYKKIWHLRRETNWGAIKISRALGISEHTISVILKKCGMSR